MQTSLDTPSRLPSLFQSFPLLLMLPFPPARMAYTGARLGAQASTTPPPATGEGTSRQWPMRVGFHVPQRHSSVPLFGS